MNHARKDSRIPSQSTTVSVAEHEQLKAEYAELQKAVTAMRQQRDQFGLVNKRLEQEIESRSFVEQRLLATIESAPTAMVMIDRSGTIVLVNRETEKLFGFSREELLGSTVEKLIPDRFRQRHPEMRNQFFREPTDRRMGAGRDLFGLRRDGSEVPIEIGLNPLVVDGKTLVLSAIVDISERLRAQTVLEETRHELIDLAENSNFPMLWMNDRGVVDWSNQALLDLLACSADQLVGQKFSDFLVESTSLDKVWPRLVAAERVAEMEFQLIDQQGMTKYVSVRFSPYVPKGILKHVRCMLTDITEKKRAAQLLERRAQEATLLHQVVALAASSDSFELTLQESLALICRTFDWPLGHVFRLQKDATPVLVSADIWYVREEHEARDMIHATKQCRFEMGDGLPGRVWKQRQPVWINDIAKDSNYPRNKMVPQLHFHAAFAFPVILNGEIRAVLEFYQHEAQDHDASLMDVMKNIGIQLGQTFQRVESRHELEHRALQLERSNRELEEFAYVASHDLKSPLRAILHLSQWIDEDPENQLSKQSKADLEQLQSRSSSMSRLLDDLLAYSRVGRKAHEMVTVDCGELVSDIVDSLFKPDGFGFEIGKALPVFDAPLVPLRLVLQNLIENSIKHHDRTDGNVNINGKIEGEFVQFTIRDDGPGIPDESRGKVFEMFVTLSEARDAESSGMGLALVKKTIESYGGTIEVVSIVGERGTQFVVNWPLVASMSTQIG